MTGPPLHPEVHRLESFARGQLQFEEIDRVQEHLADCAPCRQVVDGVSDDALLALIRRASIEPDPFSAFGVAVAETAFVPAGSPAPDPSAGAGLAYADSVAEPVDGEIPEELAHHPRYRVLEVIGRGGMGVVYKAEHRLMQRLVALKMIHRRLTEDPQAVERFQREVRAAASLSHGNIVAAYDAEQAGDTHFLAMEYVEGTDLADLVKRRGPLPVAEAVDYVEQVAEGLQKAHEQGMVHRDIKPHNLMLTNSSDSSLGTRTPRKVVKILDFGLASLSERPVDRDEPLQGRGDLTAVGAIMGTPDYMSPEQASDARSVRQVRSDIYSLGATFYFLLTGRPPFAGESISETLRGHSELDVERVDQVRRDVRPELADVVDRMMSKDVAARFQTPAELVAALTPFMGEPKSGGRRDAVDAADDRRPSWRGVWVATLAMALSLVAISGAIYYVKTDRGTLIIESRDPGIEVVIRSDWPRGRDRGYHDRVAGRPFAAGRLRDRPSRTIRTPIDSTPIDSRWSATRMRSSSSSVSFKYRPPRKARSSTRSACV